MVLQQDEGGQTVFFVTINFSLNEQCTICMHVNNTCHHMSRKYIIVIHVTGSPREQIYGQMTGENNNDSGRMIVLSTHLQLDKT